MISGVLMPNYWRVGCLIFRGRDFQRRGRTEHPIFGGEREKATTGTMVRGAADGARQWCRKIVIP